MSTAAECLSPCKEQQALVIMLDDLWHCRSVFNANAYGCWTLGNSHSSISETLLDEGVNQQSGGLLPGRLTGYLARDLAFARWTSRNTKRSNSCSRQSSNLDTCTATPKQGIPIDAFGHSIDSASRMLRKVFDLLDENGDGSLSADDVCRFLTKLGLEVQLDTLAALIRSITAGTSGLLQFDDFLSLYNSMPDGTDHMEQSKHDSGSPSGDADLHRAFQVFDTDGDGLISPLELRDALRNMGFQEGESIFNCEEMIQKVDEDGNGQVDFLEFKNMMGCRY